MIYNIKLLGPLDDDYWQCNDRSGFLIQMLSFIPATQLRSWYCLIPPLCLVSSSLRLRINSFKCEGAAKAISLERKRSNTGEGVVLKALQI